MKLIDRQYLATPFYGSRKIAAWLKSQNYSVNRKRVRRPMRIMEIKAIYRRPMTSKPASGHKIYPYLVAIIDWYSRYVLSWRLSNTLDTGFCVEVLEEALKKGKPDIFNTDQGAQFTSEAFTGLLEQHGVKISMDGKGSYNDNLFIERLWRTVKYEEVYLKAYQDGREARIGLGNYFRFYNTERPHQTHRYRTPAEVYTSTPVESTSSGMVESLPSDPLRIAGPNLNIAPILS